MLSWTLFAALAATPPTGFTASVERIPVTPTGGKLTVKVEPLLGRIVVSGGVPGGKGSQLCPKVERKDGTVTLHCRTRRLWAGLTKDRKGTFLDIRQVVGVSWLDLEGAPLITYRPGDFYLPDACPGQLLVSQAECALGRGEEAKARQLFTRCLETPDQGVCRLRLGDLALRAGDLEAALAFWEKVPAHGPQGRLATQRSCELAGTCLDPVASRKTRDAHGLTPPMKIELGLAAVRRELAMSRDAEAMNILIGELERESATCDGAQAQCQKFVYAGLVSDDPEARMGALSVFLRDRVRRNKSDAVMNEAASAAARDLGAPAFAASILSASTPEVTKAKLPQHLLSVTELYLEAGDAVRAAVVLEYAETKLGSAARSGAWAATRRQLARLEEGPPPAKPQVDPSAAMAALSDSVALSTDLARAVKARSMAAFPGPASPAPETAP